jgi:hypothetical protein
MSLALAGPLGQSRQQVGRPDQLHPAIDRALAAFLHILTVSDHEDNRL